MSTIIPPLALRILELKENTAFFATVTPADAAYIRENWAFTNQRTLRSWRVALYANEIAEGRFDKNWLRIVYIVGINRYAVINSNHTLEGIKESAKAEELVVSLEIVPTLDAANKKYALMDTPESVRSFTEVHAAYEIPGLTKVQTRALFSASRVIELDFYSKFVMNQRILRTTLTPIAERYADAAILFNSICGVERNKFLRRIRGAGVMSVALVTLDEVPEIALPFWTKVVQGTNLMSRTDPAYALRDRLIAMPGGGGNQFYKPLCALVAYCWNKNYDGDTVTYVRSVEFRLAGTVKWGGGDGE